MLSYNCLSIVGIPAGMCCVVVSPSTRGCCKYQVSGYILIDSSLWFETKMMDGQCI